MKYYKRIVCTGIGLTIMLVFSALYAVLFVPVDLPDGIPAGLLSPIAFSFCFLVFYLLYALLIAEYLSSDTLKKRIWAPITVLILSALYVALCCVYGLDDIGCGVLVLSFLLLLSVVIHAVNESSFAVVTGLPVLCFYAFLTANALLLAVFKI